MPQMFPMPALTLMTLVGILFLASLMRVFWQSVQGLSETKSDSSLNIKMSKPFSFSQTW